MWPLGNQQSDRSIPDLTRTIQLINWCSRIRSLVLHVAPTHGHAVILEYAVTYATAYAVTKSVSVYAITYANNVITTTLPVAEHCN